MVSGYWFDLDGQVRQGATVGLDCGCGSPGARLATYRHPKGETVVVEMAPEDAAHVAKTGETGRKSATSQTRQALEEASARLVEVLCKRTAGGRTAWCAGPRIAQGRHVLGRARRRWLRNEREDGPAMVEGPPGHPGPVLVLRGLKSTGAAYRINGNLDHLTTACLGCAAFKPPART